MSVSLYWIEQFNWSNYLTASSSKLTAVYVSWGLVYSLTILLLSNWVKLVCFFPYQPITWVLSMARFRKGLYCPCLFSGATLNYLLIQNCTTWLSDLNCSSLAVYEILKIDLEIAAHENNRKFGVSFSARMRATQRPTRRWGCCVRHLHLW